MTHFTNTEQRYGAVAILLHWLMAVLLIVLTALGLYMVRLPDVGFDTRKIALIIYHKELGILAIIAALLRLSWRVGSALPRLVDNLSDWQKVTARLVHLCFYGLMLALPVTGWLLSSAAGFSVSFFGWFNLPDVVLFSDYLYHTFTDLHKWLGYALIVLILIHAVAALGHHWLFKDETLKKMLPATRP